MDNKVSKFWWWNRFTAWLYHVVHGIKDDGGLDHLKECKHCRDGFNKWKKRNG